MTWTAERRQRYAERMKKQWQEKNYRKHIVEKQKEIGYRAYGSKLTHKPKVYGR